MPSSDISRSRITVTLDYYAYPRGRTATVKFYDRGSRLAKLSGTLVGDHPLTFTPHEMGKPLPRPAYEVITVDGIVDIVEHREMEPVFYMTDDPDVWAKWGSGDTH